jgi:hypothetical protein
MDVLYSEPARVWQLAQMVGWTAILATIWRVWRGHW